MKKISFVFTALTIFSAGLFAQGKNVDQAQTGCQHFWYAGLDGGYGFSSLKQQISTENTSTQTQSNEKGVYASLGRGFVAGVYGGYMFNNTIGLECGFSDLQGTKLKAKSSYNNSEQYETDYQSTMMRANIGLRMSYGKSRIKLYSRMAFLIGFAAKVNYSGFGTDNVGLPMENGITYSGGLSFGFKGGVGVAYDINDHLSFFSELTLFFQNWAPEKSTITKDIYKGVDEMPLLTIHDKNTQYVNAITTYNTSQNIDNIPEEALKFYYPFSSIGLNIGLKYRLGKYSTAVTPAYLK